MGDWQSSGYVTQTEYTHGYHPEMNPTRARFLFAVAGLEFPSIEAACELGFGQGVSLNIHAAASGARWHGTDFNPAHAAHARDLASRSGAPVRLADDAFSDFAARTDLPDFDYIAMHGVWSWISPENRRALVTFIERRLKPGGIVFASYNTLPGWGPMLSVRRLMRRHADWLDNPASPIADRIGRAIEFVRALQAVDPACWGKDGPARALIADLTGQDPKYLAHEYFNRDWHPMHFDEVAEELSAARLDFGCSAQYLEHIPSLSLSPQQRNFVETCPDPVTRELTRDLVLDRKFRRDYWVRGARRIDPRQQRETLRQTRFMLLARPGAAKTRLRSPRGEIALRDEATTPIIEALDGQSRPSTLAEIEHRLAPGTLPFDALVESLLLQIELGNVAVTQDNAQIARARPYAAALNSHLLETARFDSGIRHLASPVTGGGVPIDRLGCLLLRSRLGGGRTAEEISAMVWRELRSSGEKVTWNGKPLETDEENEARLTALAREFLDGGARVFETLGICAPDATGRGAD